MQCPACNWHIANKDRWCQRCGANLFRPVMAYPILTDYEIGPFCDSPRYVMMAPDVRDLTPWAPQQESKMKAVVKRSDDTPRAPFFWEGTNGTIWLRTKHGTDIAVAPLAGSGYRIGDVSQSQTSEATAWLQRMPDGATVTLTQG